VSLWNQIISGSEKVDSAENVSSSYPQKSAKISQNHARSPVLHRMQSLVDLLKRHLIEMLEMLLKE
jgi:hypothetical protein